MFCQTMLNIPSLVRMVYSPCQRISNYWLSVNVTSSPVNLSRFLKSKLTASLRFSSQSQCVQARPCFAVHHDSESSIPVFSGSGDILSHWRQHIHRWSCSDDPALPWCRVSMTFTRTPFSFLHFEFSYTDTHRHTHAGAHKNTPTLPLFCFVQQLNLFSFSSLREKIMCNGASNVVIPISIAWWWCCC